MTYDLVVAEINRLLEGMSEMDQSSEEYRVATENLERLCTIKLEQEKADSETKRAFWDTVARNGIEAGAVLLNLGFRSLFMVKGLKFEQTGNYVYSTNKMLFKDCICNRQYTNFREH